MCHPNASSTVEFCFADGRNPALPLGTLRLSPFSNNTRSCGIIETGALLANGA
jgi:hypothetical protein